MLKRAAVVGFFVCLYLGRGDAGQAQTAVDSSSFFNSIVYIVADAQIVGSVQHRKFYSTGVIVSAEGHVLTTAHSIPDLTDPQTYTNVQITGVIGNKFGYPIPLSRANLTNEKADLTILKFPVGPAFKPAQVSSVLNVEPDAYVTIAGFPLNLDISILHGRIVTLNGDNDTWITDAKVQEGSSGSPVFDSAGLLIGIVAGGFQSGQNPQPLGLNTIIPISKARSLGAGLSWQVTDRANRSECKNAPVTLSGDSVTIPSDATIPLKRDIRPSDLPGILASAYPNVILDNATVRLPETSPHVYRFCRLELRGGSRIVVGSDQLRILTNYLVIQDGRFVGISQEEGSTVRDPDPVTAVGQPGRAGTPGRSSGTILLTTLAKFEGTLGVELEGEHGGNGGTGGPGIAGAPGAAGVGGSDSLFDCRRGPGDGERGSPGGQGSPGGSGGPGGNGGNLQVYLLSETIFPKGSVRYGGRGGRGGNGGLGGQGGSGGIGGPKGSQTTWCRGGNPGPSGPIGSNGPSGSPGADGLDGTFQQVVVGSQDIINLF